MKITLTTKLTPEQVAEAFCELTDDEMAQTFEHVARISQEWNSLKGSGGASMQWFLTGSHLRKCECITDAGRGVVDAIHEAMHYTEKTP